MKQLIYIMAVLLGFGSCTMKPDRSEKLNDVEAILASHPDSALALLDTLHIASYNLYDQNRFFLYRTIARELTYQDISMDKELEGVYHYFKDNNFDEMAGVAALFWGRVLHQNELHKDAITYYSISENYAKKTDNKQLHGYVLYWVGMLMLDQNMFTEAKDKLEEARNIFVETDNHLYEIKLYKNIGVSYLIAEEPDSSLLFFDKAYDLASRYSQTTEMAQIKQNMAVVLIESESYREAVNVLKEAIAIDSSVHQSGRVFLNLANSYASLNRIDSAYYFAHESLEISTKDELKYPDVIASTYRFLAGLAESTGDYKKALEYNNLYTDNFVELISKNQAAAVVEAEKKYKFEVMQKENIALSLKQLNTQRILILSCLVIAIMVIVYTLVLLRKNRQLMKANGEILGLSESLNELNTTKASYHDNLLHNFNVLKRAASLEYFVQDSANKQGKLLIKRFNEIAYGSEHVDWEILYNIINSVSDGKIEQIRSLFPNLDDTEYKIVSLIYSKFNSNEIAAITRLSINTVHVKTTQIRKKMNIEKYGNIVDFVNGKLAL